ncbi:MAG: hypothetical protein AAF634_05330 [Bacteroidota bacterium]
MGRKRLKKEEEPPVLFPMDSNGEVPEISKMTIGSIIRIGAPSNRYYQYIHCSLDFFNHSLEDLSEMLHLEGVKARVMGMVKLNGGGKYAVVECEEDPGFLKENSRLFIETLPALKNHEVIVEKIPIDN